MTFYICKTPSNFSHNFGYHSGIGVDDPFSSVFLMTGLLQKLKCQLRDVLPCLLDVMWLSSACTDGKAQDKAAWELTRHQMDLSALGDPFQQLLVQFIGALRGQSKEELHQLGFVPWLLNN